MKLEDIDSWNSDAEHQGSRTLDLKQHARKKHKLMFWLKPCLNIESDIDSNDRSLFDAHSTQLTHERTRWI